MGYAEKDPSTPSRWLQKERWARSIRDARKYQAKIDAAIDDGGLVLVDVREDIARSDIRR